VCSAALLGAVHAVIGPDVAVENTFLVVKWPGSDFEIPWHQDGIDRRIELDPDRSVSAWLAVTDATVSTGCLEVIHGSQRLGYLPYGPSPPRREGPHRQERLLVLLPRRGPPPRGASRPCASPTSGCAPAPTHPQL
jgi:hypothetical protein